MGIVWWATAGASFVAMFNLLGVAGFLLGLFLWISSFAVAVHYAQQRVRQLYPAIILASGLCMLAFACLLFYEVARPLLGL